MIFSWSHSFIHIYPKRSSERTTGRHPGRRLEERIPLFEQRCTLILLPVSSSYVSQCNHFCVCGGNAVCFCEV